MSREQGPSDCEHCDKVLCRTSRWRFKAIRVAGRGGAGRATEKGTETGTETERQSQV